MAVNDGEDDQEHERDENGVGSGDIALDMKMKPAPPRKRSRFESALWLLACVAVLVIGDGKRHFFQAVLKDARVQKQPFFVACVCIIVNVAVWLYLTVLIRLVLRNTRHFELAAPGANATTTLLSFMAFILFAIALWPVFGFFIIPILWVFFMTLVVILSTIPPYSPKSAEDME
ncbi:hypothetical protein CLOM_g7319 [Closterium sp. NIES-68]|nr:hypothetical protein CLOM_g7319 [Closterium sp. NIES-68]GJP62614.1 hypothetical protein CLOP_g19652 [Closterium sp. NIES-67]